MDNALGIFGDPSDTERKLQGAGDAAAGKTNTEPACIYHKFPIHLCCETEGPLSPMGGMNLARCFAKTFMKPWKIVYLVRHSQE